MKRTLIPNLLRLLGLLVLASTCTGCHLCGCEHDWDYAGVGGKHPRSSPTHGRVGSPMSDPAMGSTMGRSWQLEASQAPQAAP
jgi:hypothetical protein